MGEKTGGARGVCGGMVLFGRLVDNTSPSSSLSGAPPLSIPPTPPSLPIRLMVTDKQAKIFDKTRTPHRDLLEASKHPFFF